MTDDERLAIVQIALGKASVLFMSQPEGGKIVMPVEGLLEVAHDIASIWSKDVREGTGAQGREQDVSDRLLVEMIHALGCDLLVCEECCILEDRIAEIQRARAAGKKAGVDICATR